MEKSNFIEMARINRNIDEKVLGAAWKFHFFTIWFYIEKMVIINSWTYMYIYILFDLLDWLG